MFHYPLRATVRETSWSGDSQYISKASSSTEEASIIVSVRINPSGETLWSAQSEFHSVLVTRLTYCEIKSRQSKIIAALVSTSKSITIQTVDELGAFIKIIVAIRFEEGWIIGVEIASRPIAQFAIFSFASNCVGVERQTTARRDKTG